MLKTGLCVILSLFCILVFNPQAMSNSIEPSIGDFVWEDLNGNGIQDAGESGIAGVPVGIYTDANASPANLILYGTTNSDGNYFYHFLGDGTYWVKFTLPSGYFFTAQNAGGDNTVDSDADPFTGIAGGSSGIALSANEYDDSWDAGLRPVPIPAAIYLLGAGFIGLAGLRRKLKR